MTTEQIMMLTSLRSFSWWIPAKFYAFPSDELDPEADTYGYDVDTPVEFGIIATASLTKDETCNLDEYVVTITLSFPDFSTQEGTEESFNFKQNIAVLTSADFYEIITSWTGRFLSTLEENLREQYEDLCKQNPKTQDVIDGPHKTYLGIYFPI